jgi:hypothetical protein
MKGLVQGLCARFQPLAVKFKITDGLKRGH